MRAYAIAAVLALGGLCAFAFVPEPSTVQPGGIVGVDVDADAQALHNQAVTALENLRHAREQRVAGTTGSL